MPETPIPSINICYIHGWGMMPSFWDSLISALPNHNAHTIDLGFQGQEAVFENSILKDKEFDFIIAHSLGGPWAIKNKINARKGIIFINSFQKFTAFTAPQILSEMQRTLDKNPALQMKQFLRHSNCLPAITDFGAVKWNATALHTGLEWLKTWDITTDLAPVTVPILSLGGNNDRICPPDTFIKHWDNVETIMNDNGDHAMPHSATSWTARQITNWIDKHT